MDILDRINAKLIDTDQAILRDSIAEIQQLRAAMSARSRLLADIFNCDEAPELPLELRQRIENESNGRKAAIPGATGPIAFRITPKNGGMAYIRHEAPDSWELRECQIEAVPAGEANAT